MEEPLKIVEPHKRSQWPRFVLTTNWQIKQRDDSNKSETEPVEIRETKATITMAFSLLEE